MKKLQLVDLKTQYEKIKEEVDKAILDVIATAAFINGPEVKEFQKDLGNYLGVKHVIPCANGTDALQISLMALGLKPGDEVISPSFTYIATAEVIGLLNLTPVFIDVDRQNFTIDIQSLRNAITKKTKAIVPVHLYGHCANMEEILKIANEFNIPVIEDTAQALGSEFTFSDGSVKKAGTIGKVGCTSFFPSKNLGCYGDGGAIMTNDDDLAKTIRMVASHGQSKKYFHDIIGVNSRLDSIQAAVLRVKLPYLKEYILARKSAASYYSKAFEPFEELETPFVEEWSDHGFHQYTLVLHNLDREALITYLKSKDIPSNVYYPMPTHEQGAFKNTFEKRVSLENTEYLTQTVLSLPIHTELDTEQLEYITSSIIEFIKYKN